MKSIDKNTRQINLEHLYALAEGDKGFVREMIEYYLGQVPTVIQDMQRYQSAKDWQELGELAHKAKSSFKFMGIQQLTEDARHLEEICRAHPSERLIEPIIERIGALMVVSSEELRQELVNLS